MEVCMKNIFFLSPQEIFNFVVLKLLEQNSQSRSGFDKVCLYRGYGGRKCAIGHIFKDDEYKPKFEYNNALRAIGMFFGLSRGFVETLAIGDIEEKLANITGSSLSQVMERLRFCEDLQTIHDQFWPYEWEDKFYKLAAEKGLDCSCISEFRRVKEAAHGVSETSGKTPD